MEADMSRSYKKYPCCKDGNRRKKRDKQLANRRIRRGSWKDVDIPSGRKYRQAYNTWDICDYRFVETFAEFIARHQRWYVEAVDRLGQERADKYWADDWRELYRNWARYCLWK